MTIDQAPVEVLDLALELFYAGDANSLTAALALAEDLNATLAPLVFEWDAAVSVQAADAGDWDTAFAALPF